MQLSRNFFPPFLYISYHSDNFNFVILKMLQVAPWTEPWTAARTPLYVQVIPGFNNDGAVVDDVEVTAKCATMTGTYILIRIWIFSVKSLTWSLHYAPWWDFIFWRFIAIRIQRFLYFCKKFREIATRHATTFFCV